MDDAEMAVLQTVENYRPDTGAVSNVLADRFSDEEVRAAVTSLLAQSMLALEYGKLSITPYGTAPIHEGKHRVTFDFTKEAFQVFEELQMSCGYGSRAETFRHACRLLQWVREETLQGGELGIKKGDAVHIIDLDSLGLDMPK